MSIHNKRWNYLPSKIRNIMLLLKLIPTENLTCYRIKIDNEIIDQGILYTQNEKPWMQREPTVLEYKGISFEVKNGKFPWKPYIVSVTCTNAGGGREIYIQEIVVNDVNVISQGRGESYNKLVRPEGWKEAPYTGDKPDEKYIEGNANFNHEHIVSGCSKNLERVIKNDYDDVIIMDRAGIMGDWFFSVNQGGTEIAFFDEELYFARQNVTFTKEKNKEIIQ